jgi:hypothetical protein
MQAQGNKGEHRISKAGILALEAGRFESGEAGRQQAVDFEYQILNMVSITI